MLGVKDMHAMAGAYSAVRMPDVTILVANQVLQSMQVGAKPIGDKALQPAALGKRYRTCPLGPIFPTSRNTSLPRSVS